VVSMLMDTLKRIIPGTALAEGRDSSPSGEASDQKLPRSRKTSESRSSDAVPIVTSGGPHFWLTTDKEVDRHLHADSAQGESSDEETVRLDVQEDAKVSPDNAAEAQVSGGDQDLHEALTEVFSSLEARGMAPLPLSSQPKPQSLTTFYHQQEHSNTISQPLTPLQGASPMGLGWGSAMPSSPKSGSLHSLRLSDVDSPIDVEEGTFEERIRSSLVQSEPPQLIMPNLSMPDRRPITDRGRAMGNVRVCVAGAKGKTKDKYMTLIC
jgi:hypothetical protein